MKREIIVIDDDKCTGCGLCVPGCHEGALQIIDGKARLISELFCDGLGACLGHCPEGALTIEEREAEAYNELKVMELMMEKGENTLLAHLRHLKDHGELVLLGQALQYLEESGYKTDTSEFLKKEKDVKEVVREVFGHSSFSGMSHSAVGCPGSKAREFKIDTAKMANASEKAGQEIRSELRQWPVQLHLLNPNAGYFINADVILAADCAAYSAGDFHSKYLRGKTLAIACPKLDSNLESYVAKLKSMMSESKINSLTVLRMEVPCCGGLLHMARTAALEAGWNNPIREIVLGVQGDLLSENMI